MASGVLDGLGQKTPALMSYHPQPTQLGGSSSWFHNENWLDFNMHQTGHCANKGTYRHIRHDYNLQPVKPVIDGEPLYEDHPNCFNAKDLGYSVAGDIRRIMYWNVFAGAAGQSYGCHDVWQMYLPGRSPINGPLRPWKEALDLPMANQVRHLKNLMLSRPYFSRIPDQSMVVKEQSEFEDYVIATRDEKGSYAMIYFPTGMETTIDLSALGEGALRSWWFDPRTGASFPGERIEASGHQKFIPPSNGKRQDWVLVIDRISADFSRPGKVDSE